MGHIPVYGMEHTFLDEKTGLLYRNSRFRQTASIHTHTFYEFFIVAEGSALHLVNDSIQTITQGILSLYGRKIPTAISSTIRMTSVL